MLHVQYAIRCASYHLYMSKRSAALASAVREIIAPVLRTCPLECGVVSFTEVVVSADGAYATAYVSALRNPEAALAYLESQRARLQRDLGCLRSRHIPRLRFRVDETPIRASRIDALLSGMDIEPNDT